MTGYIAIFGWPLAAAAFFARMTVPAAICATIIGGYLFLPLEPVIDLPLLPPLDKNLIPALAALVLALSASGRTDGRAGQLPLVPSGKLLLGLLGLMLGGSVLTAFTNTDTLRYGSMVLQGMRPYDGMSLALAALVLVLPLLIGRAFIAEAESHRALLAVLMIFGAIYALLALYEIRMSPQLNRMVYGFFPHSWVQHIRNGNWRPIVFLQHGLWLAIFMCMATLAAIAMAKSTIRSFAPWLTILIAGTLAVSSNLGALLILIVLAPVLLLLRTHLQLLIAAGIAGLVLVYPMARATGYVPIDPVLSVANSISAERTASLEYRLRNEDILLDKARERPLFGWGGFARNRVFDERGRDISVTDGYWVIVFGIGGWARYIGTMGLLCMPVLLLAWRRKTLASRPETAALALVLTANLIDLIPNAGQSPITWLIAGALWGQLSGQDVSPPPNDGEADDTANPGPVSPYTRQTKRMNRHQHQTMTQGGAPR